jgi:hypothetical protein
VSLWVSSRPFHGCSALGTPLQGKLLESTFTALGAVFKLAPRFAAQEDASFLLFIALSSMPLVRGSIVELARPRRADAERFEAAVHARRDLHRPSI